MGEGHSKSETLSEIENGTDRAELHITPEEARHLANLLRYTISLNTTVGLVSPTDRRLSTPTYRAVELAARVLEGKTFDEALEESETAWTGSLQEDHHRALELLESTRKEMQDVITGRLSPERAAQLLEVTQEQFLELLGAEISRSLNSSRK